LYFGVLFMVSSDEAQASICCYYLPGLCVTWKAAGWPRFRGDTTHVSNVVAGALMTTVFISLAGWLAGVCELQHQLLLQRHA
jgi:hypothetical protein